MTEEKKKEFDNTPIIESRVDISKDGKWIIHKTTITDIKAVNFYKKVMENEQKPKVTEEKLA